MDIKLKNSNNVITKLGKSILNRVRYLNLNKRMWIMSICISIFPALLAMAISHPYVRDRVERVNRSNIHAEIGDVTRYIDELNYLMIYSDKYFRQEAIDEEINKLKVINNEKVTKAKLELDNYLKNNNLDESKISPYDRYYKIFIDKIDNLEKIYNKDESEYEKEAIDIIKSKISKLESRLNEDQVNIEYYMRSSENNIITNIYGESDDEIIKETLNGGFEDYIILSDIIDNAAGTKYFSKSMEAFINRIKIDNTYTKVIRIS